MKKHLFIAAAAVVALASCTTSDEFFDPAQETAQQELNDNAIRFGTYLGNQTVTRAGTAGSVTTESLKTGTHKDAGFGVFAYYTGTTTYNSNAFYGSVKTDGTSGQTTQKANFMYNQQVKWNASAAAGNVTKWEYTPMKYWPNEVQQGAVDDQTNPAVGEGNYGGNVSFFAYAPYVDAAITPTTDGIVAINGETTLAAGNVKTQDPILTYIVSTTGSNVVDLLWGTKGTTGKNVLGSGNTGATYNASGTNYEKSILNSYSLNADLTKQKTDGKVDFAFKHALAKVGGSELYTGGSVGVKHGLMIKLDIDDQKGAETGGTYDNTKTKVTVKEIKIEARSKYDVNKDSYLDVNEYLKSARGDFNLATGRWGVYTTSNTGVLAGAAITTHIINQAGTGTDVAGALNTTIAEPASVLAKTASGWSGLVEGVLTSEKNVYSTEAAPLVFIPGTYPELTITVDYIVRTLDDHLADAYSEVEQKIKKIVTFTSPVELNKQYNLLMHLGLTSVKFDATVSNWVVDGDANGDGTITSPETLTVTDVYLPINVAP